VTDVTLLQGHVSGERVSNGGEPLVPNEGALRSKQVIASFVTRDKAGTPRTTQPRRAEIKAMLLTSPHSADLFITAHHCVSSILCV
jgi:hypothetical protein